MLCRFFRLASSGFSQVVDASGHVLAYAPVPGEGATITGTLSLGKPGTVPLDRFLAPIAVAIDAVIILALVILRFVKPVKTPEFKLNPA